MCVVLHMQVQWMNVSKWAGAVGRLGRSSNARVGWDVKSEEELECIEYTMCKTM